MIANSHATIDVAGEQQLFARVSEALRVMVEWQAPKISQQRQATSMRFALRSFCRHLQRLMAFEEAGDYLESLAEERPDCQPRVGLLRQEHDRLREQMAALEPTIDEPSAWRDDQLEASRSAVMALLEDVDRHNRHEIDLLQETLLREDGVGD
ncbi:MAG: hemerythrin domain-containing protein [Planctomycetota bacterium]